MNFYKKMSLALLSIAQFSALLAHEIALDECCNTPSTFCCLDGLSLRAEGVYLWAGENDLQYASLSNYTQSVTDARTETLSNNKYKTPKFSSRLGYRIGIDYEQPASSIGASLTYFHFNTSAHGKVLSPQSAFVSGKIGSENAFVTPLFSRNLDQDNPFTNCKANLNVNINIVDLDFGKLFCYSSCFKFKPFIGIRYADICQHYKIRSNGLTTGSDRLQNIVTNEYNKLKCDFSGFGIHAGLDNDWSIGCGFSLYGKAAGSILYGRNHRKNISFYNQNNFTDATVVDFNQNIRAHCHGPFAIIELGIGVKYDYCICSDNTVSLKLGWEQMMFFNKNRFDNSISSNIGSAYSFSRNGDLGLQGIVFGASYTF